jgi:hypothetical protein
MFLNVTLIESRSPAPLAWTSPGNPTIEIGVTAQAKQRLFDCWQRAKRKPNSEGCIACLITTNQRLAEPSINRSSRRPALI